MTATPMLDVTELPVRGPDDRRAYYALVGRLDAATSSQLERALNRALSATIVLDMSRLTYVSSSGLRVLLTARRKARERNGDVVLCGLTQNVRDVFNMVGFSALFTIRDSLDEAR